MEKYSEVVGIQVVNIIEGKIIGFVSDVIFIPEGREVKGFMVRQRGEGPGKRVLLLENVRKIGRNKILVEDSDVIKSIKDFEKYKKFKEIGKLKGLKIMSKTGDSIGSVNDVFFDCMTGVVEAVEVSDGLVQDIFNGRKIMPMTGRISFTKDIMYVDTEALEEMMDYMNAALK